MTFWDGIILIIIGLIGLYRGFTNKKTPIWKSFNTHGQKWLGVFSPQFINIISGILCTIVGVLLLIKNR
jgi:uncharacterized membrane protein